MKKLTSIMLVLAMIVALCFSVNAADFSSSNAIDYAMKLEATSTNIKVGDTVTIKMYVYDKTNGGDLHNSSSVSNAAALYYPTSAFEVTGSTKTSESSSESLNFNANSINYSTQSVEMTYVAGAPFATVTFKALSEGEFEFYLEGVDGECSFGGVDFYFAEEEGGTEEYGLVEAPITVKVTAAEEVFTPSYEGVKAEDGSVTEGFAAGSKVATVFAKAETALTAGTYGIVFGGQKYVGAGDVAEGKYWVIRLYDPSGNILTGASYTCQKFVGDAYETVDYELENN